MKNPIKIMLVAVLLIAVVTLVFVAFKKDKIVLEDEEGNQYVGYSSKISLKKSIPEVVTEVAEEK